jgi:glycosyltransferase involved in cell wall biosynthesis
VRIILNLYLEWPGIDARLTKTLPIGNRVFPPKLCGVRPLNFSAAQITIGLVNERTGTAGLRPATAKYISIGIIAWNEQDAIGPMLNSLFQQSIFAELSQRGQIAEIICITNGCTDRTPEVAREVLARHAQVHPHAHSFACRLVDLEQRGKINAWNLFVHWLSAREAKFLFLLDSDILIHRLETLRNLMLTLEHHDEAHIAVDQPRKDIEFLPRRTWRQRLSLAASQLTRSSAAQLCGQLYCIRAGIARNIYLPKDLAACEDGFIKTLVCTDFLAHPVWPMRIQTAPDAAHTFAAYTSLAGIYKNQKRQAIGQTMVHVLVDEYLKTLAPLQRSQIGVTLQEKEREDPDWLKRLIREHLGRTRFFWQLYPGLLSYRFQRLARLGWPRRIKCLPATIVGSAASLVSGIAARRFLKAGCTNYWPRTHRAGLDHSQPDPPPAPQFTP